MLPLMSGFCDLRNISSGSNDIVAVIYSWVMK